MTSVAQILTVMGYPVPREMSGPGKKVWKRGRVSLADPCPELKTKPCWARWMTEEEAATELGTDHDGIISMIKRKELRPAIHRGVLFLSIDSVRRKTSATVHKPPPTSRPVWFGQMPVLAIPSDSDSEPEAIDPDPDPEDILDETPEERDEFIPIKLTKEITNSKAWTSDRHRSFKRTSDPYVNKDLEIRLVEYAPGQFGYRIEDVAEVMNKVPLVVQNFITGHKVEADPTGRYVTQKSLKAFIKRSRGVEIRDI